MNNTDKGVVALFIGWLLALLIIVAFWVAVIWIVLHFVHKFW